MTRVTAPNAPTAGSAITSRRRSGGMGGNNPSAASASPSRWRYPVSTTSDASAIAAAAAAGHARPANHHTAPTPSPIAAPTTGNQSSVPGEGVAAPPNGVRNASALTHQSAEGCSRWMVVPAPRDDFVGLGRHRLVERSQGVTEPASLLGRRMNRHPDLLRDHHGVAGTSQESETQRLHRRRSCRERRSPMDRGSRQGLIPPSPGQLGKAFADLHRSPPGRASARCRSNTRREVRNVTHLESSDVGDGLGQAGRQASGHGGLSQEPHPGRA